VDPELHTVRYAFDSAYQRMCEAETDDALMAELSNLLHHMYRLRMLCISRLGKADFHAKETTADLRAARAASWARNADTHKLYAPAAQQTVYANVYTARYGVLVWRPRSSVPAAPDKDGRYLDYEQVLEGKVVLATLRRAFEAMAALL
jgi:hypothetical protein